MITRINDFSGISEESFDKIKEACNKKLYATCHSDNELNIAKKEIKLKGYNYNVVPISSTDCNVYYYLPEKVKLSDVRDNKQFKKLAWGRYCFQKQSGIGDFQKLNFDDGSIWKVIKDENGEEYLVKEIDENDDVIRNSTKVASIKHIADNICFIDDGNVDAIMQILYHNSSTPNTEFLNDIMKSNIKNEIYKILADKMDNLIVEKLQNQNISDKNLINKIVGLIQKQIDDNKIVDENTLENVIYNCIQEQIYDSSASL